MFLIPFFIFRSLTDELTWRRGQLLMITEPKPVKVSKEPTRDEPGGQVSVGYTPS